MSELKITAIAIMDCRHTCVYCRSCGRREIFWSQIKHTRGCEYVDEFARLAESPHGLFGYEKPVVVRKLNRNVVAYVRAAPATSGER